ncbi:MAG: hypothetical protein A3G23_02410 [Bacteroidetes bacterium RIFCSPLOWO2_12_FULL_37_12]|nr:MAG: hypothetical protein A3G23_02410 [Bacteroidetes bacterium RIFCSPLOWO2_12_FULL_37_12]
MKNILIIKFYYVIAFGLLLIFSKVTIAQQSLFDLLQEAEKNNPALISQHNKYLAAMEKVNQISLPEPMGGLGYMLMPAEMRQGLQFSLMQDLPWFGMLALRREELKVMAEMEELVYREKKNNLIATIKEKWFMLFAMDRMMVSEQHHLENYQNIEKVVSSRYETGKSSLGELLEVKFMIEEIKNEITKITKEKELIKDEILLLLNRKSGDSLFQPFTLDLFYLPYPDSTLKNYILTNNPMILRMEKMIYATELGRQMLKKDSKPMFTLGFDYAILNQAETHGSSGGYESFLMPSIKLKLPIKRKKYNSWQKEKEFEIVMLNADKENVKNEMLNELNKMLFEYRNNERNIELYLKQIELTQQMVELMKTEYESMGMGFDKILHMEHEIRELTVNVEKSYIEMSVMAFKIQAMYE